MTAPTIRVLVAEDSPTARALLVAMLESDPQIVVVAEASDGAEAVTLAEALRPDLVTMDVHMPRLDGLEATREIMIRAPAPIMIVTAHDPNDVALSLDATAAGAVMVIEKPVAPSAAAFAEQRDYLVGMAKAMSQVRVVRRWAPKQPRPMTPARAVPRTADHPAVDVVAIAASTGGPAALLQLLRELPRDFPTPVLLVQHIAYGFTPGFAQWLGAGCRVDVRVASDGERLAAGTVYVAPDGAHLGVDAQRSARLSAAPPVGGFRPSATHLFESVTRVYGARTAAVILTGMGADGVEGLRAVRRARGIVFAQDEASCVVYGMPREAILAGLVDAVLPPDRIGDRLTQMTSRES